jgi:hypothetical protein
MVGCISPWGLPAKKEAYVNASSGESIFKELFEKLSGVTIPWYWNITRLMMRRINLCSYR